MVGTVGEADKRERAQGGFLALRGTFAPVDERQFKVFTGSRSLQKVEALEDEADVVAPKQRALRPVQRTDINAAKVVATAGGCIEAAKDVHGRRLSRTGRSHDGDEFAIIDGQVHPVKRAHFGFALAVDLGHLVEPDERSASHERLLSFAALLVDIQDECFAGLDVSACDLRALAISDSKGNVARGRFLALDFNP